MSVLHDGNEALKVGASNDRPWNGTVFDEQDKLVALTFACEPESAALLARQFARAMNRDHLFDPIERALQAVIAATRAYLPPDGITAQEHLSRILAATDNPEINADLSKVEAGRAK